MTNQLDNLGLQLNTFLNEFKAMFTQLINQNSMILSMLSTVINIYAQHWPLKPFVLPSGTPMFCSTINLN
jgi:hypothetical protein